MNLDLQQPEIQIAIGVGAFVVLALVFLFFRRKTKARTREIPVETSAVLPKADLQSVLEKTQESFTGKLKNLVLGAKDFDSKFFDGLEELLYTSDLGPKTVAKLLEKVREQLTRGELQNLETVKKGLFSEISEILSGAKVQSLSADGISPWVILVVGVNGVGKTTSIGKLAQFFSQQGKSVLVVAGDTFRAAAESQLAIWGERAQVDVYSDEKTRDPAAVAFQGIQKGIADKKEVIIVDTAGRLHTKENLMEELKKVKRVSNKALSGAPHETILVIDATSGQNARIQAQQFNEALGLTSLIVTKLDGTSRGGVIVGIADEVGIGVQFIGTGEQINDFQKFSNQEYAKSLLGLPS